MSGMILRMAQYLILLLALMIYVDTNRTEFCTPFLKILFVKQSAAMTYGRKVS